MRILAMRLITLALVPILTLVGGTGPAFAAYKTRTYTNQTWQYRVTYPAWWREKQNVAIPGSAVSLDFRAAAPDALAAVFSMTADNPTGDVYIDLSSSFRQGFIYAFLRSSGLSQSGSLKPGTRRVHGHLYSSYDGSFKAGNNGTVHVTALLIAYPHHIYAFFGFVAQRRLAQQFVTYLVSREPAGSSFQPAVAVNPEELEVQNSLNSIVFE